MTIRRLAFMALVAVSWLHMTAAQAQDTAHQVMFARLSALASTGHAEAKYHLGMFLNNGMGTPRDAKAAFKHFTEAAESGHPLAAYKVGCYLAGQFPGAVPVDLAEALRFKLRAAEAGYDLAQQDVGEHFWRMKDIDSALLWWERASRQGSVKATAYLAHHEAGHPSQDPVRLYVLTMLLHQASPRPAKALLDQIAQSKAVLTAEQRTRAEASLASWSTGVTALTQEARAGFRRVTALLESLEPKVK